VLLLTLWGVLTSAAPRTARLDYLVDNAPECPDALALKNAIAARLGYSPFQNDGALLITVKLSRREGLHAVIELRRRKDDAPRVRELHSSAADCSELAAAVELAVSIAIDPFDAGRPRKPLSTDEAPLPTAPLTPASPPPAPGPQAQWWFAAGVAGAAGVGPGFNAGLLLDARVRWSVLSLGLEAHLDLPLATPLQQGQVSTALLGGTARACAHLGWVSGCGVLTGGAVYARAEGFVRSNTGWLPHLGVGARVMVEVPLSARWSLRGFGEMQGRLTRISVLVDDQVAWVSGPLCGSIGILAAVAF